MDGALLRRLGSWTLASALAFALLATYALPTDPADLHASTYPLLKKIALAGALLLAFGFVADALPRLVRPPCKRCGKAAAAGSVFCPAHRDELRQAALQAGSRAGHDRRR